ncbi:unnamed protein product [Enterobius vermicularis]|uniref:TspO/MBR family protein n=1 Tax=Enterobius vermicularis TaxID=51028 RepID=A0A0N4V262_ENTVE|nr:unnamed protein product [Enterobius vermicularis]
MWTSEDTKKAILFSCIPGGIALTGFAALARDKSIVDFWKPNWAPVDSKMYSMMDLVSMAPLGYATYLVYKNGGIEYSDTRAALGLYGVNTAFQLATIPLLMKKDLKLLFWNTVLTAGSGVLTAYIDKTAGLLLLPFTLWTGFYAFLTYSLYEKNKPKNLQVELVLIA